MDDRHIANASTVRVNLAAVVVSVSAHDPRVLVLSRDISGLDALPCGPLQSGHGTLQFGLRAWVESQTNLKPGYVEQLYTFGDHMRPDAADMAGGAAAPRALSIAYLTLVRESRPEIGTEAEWRSWYSCLPWEDQRAGEARGRQEIHDRVSKWAREGGGNQGKYRRERVQAAFGSEKAIAWDEERVLERYETLYEAGLVAEAWHDKGEPPPEDIAGISGRPMAADHRRVLATAISRLRGKIKYRPVLFELMPPTFTLLQLQRTTEALSGMPLHKQNFRRLVQSQRLVEETGEIDTQTGGRPARIMRFRPEVKWERPAPGVRVSAGRPGRPNA